MREIKFRGLCLEHKIWMYGSFINYDPIPVIKQTKMGEMDYDYPENEIDFESVGQYTGLKDNQGKGKEVYEGDYFIVYDVKWVVEWQEDLCRFILTNGKGYDSKNCYDLTCDEIYYLKVAGNIHENS